MRVGSVPAAPSPDLTTLTTHPALDQLRQILELTPHADAQQRGCFLVNSITEWLPIDAEGQALVDQNQQFVETLLPTLLSRDQQ